METAGDSYEVTKKAPQSLDECFDLIANDLDTSLGVENRQEPLQTVKVLLELLPNVDDEAKIFSIEKVLEAIARFQPHTVQDHERVLQVRSYLLGRKDAVSESYRQR